MFKDIEEIISVFTFDVPGFQYSRAVDEACSAVDRLLISGNADFSFKKYLNIKSGGAGISDATNEAYSIAATALYNAALLAGLDIKERTPHEFQPGYVSPGLDSYVDGGDSDLRFSGGGKWPVLILADYDGNSITVMLAGKKEDPGLQIRIVTEVEQKYIHGTGTSFDPSIPKGEKRIVKEGRDGVRVGVYRIYSKTGGEIVKKEKISTDTYSAQEEVVLIGTAGSTPEPQFK